MYRKILVAVDGSATSLRGLDEAIKVETVGVRAADEIVKQARQWPADLIVMGTHGRRGLKRLVLGSDAELVLRQSSVPVLLVRDNTEASP